MWFLSLTPFLKSIKESALANVLTHASRVFQSYVRAHSSVLAPSRALACCCSILQHLCSPRCPPGMLAPCHLSVLGDQLLAPLYPGGCAHQHPPPRSILPCTPGEPGPCLAGGWQLPACPARILAGGAWRGGWAAFKKAPFGAEPWPSGEHGKPPFLLSSLFIVMSWRSSWRARVRPTQASSS